MPKTAMKITRSKQVHAGTFIEQQNSYKPRINRDSSVYFTELIEDPSKQVGITKNGIIYAAEFIETTL